MGHRQNMVCGVQETKSALSSHIAKVASKKATMEAFATSLKNNAFNA